jgi:hypothetical protein
MNRIVELRAISKLSYFFWYTLYNYATEGGKSVTVSSIKIWNNLPKDIKMKPSVNSFKFALKKYYLESYKGIDRFELLLWSASCTVYNLYI